MRESSIDDRSRLLTPRGLTVFAIFLSAPQKPLHQSAKARYTRRVKNHVQAPTEAPILFSADPASNRSARKSIILIYLRTLRIEPRATHSFRVICAFLRKQPGVHPQISGFETRTSETDVNRPPCSRDRSPDRGPFQMILAKSTPPLRPTPNVAATPQIEPNQSPRIFTCKKKAISVTIAETLPRRTPFTKYSAASHCADLQENDR